MGCVHLLDEFCREPLPLIDRSKQRVEHVGHGGGKVTLDLGRLCACRELAIDNGDRPGGPSRRRRTSRLVRVQAHPALGVRVAREIGSVTDATLGVSMPVAVAGSLYPGIPSAQLGIGWGLETILAERVTLGLRPFAPSLIAPNFYAFPPVGLRWEFGVSMGIVW